MKNFNAEMIEKAKAAKSAEELLELAKGSNVEPSFYILLPPQSLK